MNREQFDKAHSACPKCGNTNLRETLVDIAEVIGVDGVGVYFDDTNKAWCEDCGWNGKVNELVPAGDGIDEKIEQEVMTVDYDNIVYMSIPDTIKLINILNRAIVAKLDSDGTIKYTNSIFEHIAASFRQIQTQHSLRKEA
jgi:predicted nucleic-acid-binding Zn-ribbon protein